MNRDALRLVIDTFVTQTGRFPTRREFRKLGSERGMYVEFGGMSQMKNWYNMGASLARLNRQNTNMKDFYLNTLRTNVCMVKYQRDGSSCVSALTLSPNYLKAYVGKGTSKKANDDLIFAYDIDNKRFKAVSVSTIESCVPFIDADFDD